MKLSGDAWPKAGEVGKSVWQENRVLPENLWSLIQRMDSTLFAGDMRGWGACQHLMEETKDLYHWMAMSTHSGKVRGVGAVCKACDAMCAVAWKAADTTDWQALREAWLTFWQVDVQALTHTAPMVCQRYFFAAASRASM